MNNIYYAKYKSFGNGILKVRAYNVPPPNRKKRKTLKKKESIIDNDEKEKDLSKQEVKKLPKNKKGKIEKRSLSRTRQELLEIVDDNESKFVSFITLTYQEEVEDITRAYKDLGNFIKCLRRFMGKEKKEELYYIAVPEIQHKRAMKTGKYVIHFHLITNVPVSTTPIPEREAKRISGSNHTGTKTIKYYNLKNWKKGYSFAVPIEKQGDFELSKYLVKYLYKDLDDRFFGRQKILHSNNLKQPKYHYIDLNTLNTMQEMYKQNLIEVYKNKIFIEGKKNPLDNSAIQPYTEYIYKTKL